MRGVKGGKSVLRNIGLIIVGAMLAILLLGLLTDVLLVYSSRVVLDNLLLEAARAGVGSQDEEMARQLIKEKAAGKDLNLADEDISINFEEKIIVITKKERVKTRFAWLLGHGSIPVYVQVKLKLKG